MKFIKLTSFEYREVEELINIATIKRISPVRSDNYDDYVYIYFVDNSYRTYAISIDSMAKLFEELFLGT